MIDVVVSKSGLLQWVYAIFFGLLIVTGVVSFYQYNLLPAQALLELLFLLAIFFISVQSLSLVSVVMAMIYALYVSVSLVYAYSIDVNLLDFLQAYKAFFYVGVLFLFGGVKYFNVRFLYLFYWYLLLALFLKYSYSLVLDLTPRMGERPGLFEENNFELMLPILLFLLISHIFGAYKMRWSALLLFVVVFISGSRSALVSLFFVFFVLYVRNDFRSYLISGVTATLGSLAIYLIFVDRMDGKYFDEIDRVRFLLYFLEEVKTWGVSDYLWGTERLTPLSESTCAALSSYRLLFSYSGDGSCYSVILHSYILRVLFDHGVLALGILCGSVYWMLMKATSSHRVAIGALGCILLSGLSVSSFNSVFVAISLFMLLTSFDDGYRPGRYKFVINP